MSNSDKNIAEGTNKLKPQVIETHRRRNESEHRNNKDKRHADHKPEQSKVHKYCSSQEWIQLKDPQSNGDLEQIYKQLVNLKSQYKSLRKAYNKLIQEKSQNLQGTSIQAGVLRAQLQKTIDQNIKLKARLEFEEMESQRVRKELSKLLEIEMFRNKKLQETLQEKGNTTAHTKNMIVYLKAEARSKQNDQDSSNRQEQSSQSNRQVHILSKAYMTDQQSTVPLAQQLQQTCQNQKNIMASHNKQRRTISEEDSDQYDDQNDSQLQIQTTDKKFNASTEGIDDNNNRYNHMELESNLSPQRPEFEETNNVLNNINISSNNTTSFMKLSYSNRKLRKQHSTIENDDDDKPLNLIKLGMPSTTKNSGYQSKLSSIISANLLINKQDLMTKGPQTPNYTRRRSATGNSKHSQPKKTPPESNTNNSLGTKKKASNTKSKKDLCLRDGLDLVSEIDSAMLRKSINTPSSSQLLKRKHAAKDNR